jgi:hypothetical protein
MSNKVPKPMIRPRETPAISRISFDFSDDPDRTPSGEAELWAIKPNYSKDYMLLIEVVAPPGYVK